MANVHTARAAALATVNSAMQLDAAAASSSWSPAWRR
jgi:hypothetical protein